MRIPDPSRYASPTPRDTHPPASPLPLNHNLSKPPRTRHFLSYSKITFGRCLNDPLSSIEKPSFKHRKDPFQASTTPPPTAALPPRHLLNSADGQAVLGQCLICSVLSRASFWLNNPRQKCRGTFSCGQGFARQNCRGHEVLRP